MTDQLNRIRPSEENKRRRQWLQENHFPANLYDRFLRLLGNRSAEENERCRGWLQNQGFPTNLYDRFVMWSSGSPNHSDSEDEGSRIPRFDLAEMASSCYRAGHESSEDESESDSRRREEINRSSHERDTNSDNRGSPGSSTDCSGLGSSMINSSLTSGEDRESVVDKKRLRSNAEKLEAIWTAKYVGTYQAAIQFGVSAETIKRWVKCERLIETKDPIDSKYYAQHHNVPEVLKKRLAEFVKGMEDIWPLEIKVVSRHFRYLAKKLGFPEFSAVPGVVNFLRVFKIEYKLQGAFVVK